MRCYLQRGKIVHRKNTEQFSEVRQVKKKICLLLCVLIASLSFAGCSGKESTVKYDKEALKQYSEIIIASFSEYGTDMYDVLETSSDFYLEYTMMSTGLPVEGENFLGMVAAWEAAIDECGDYVGHGAFEVEVKNDGAVVTTTAEFEEREAEISFAFNENSYMESMDVSAKYNVGEILTKAGLNTVLGMGVVFAVLIFLAFLIAGLKYIPVLLKLFEKKEETVAVEETPVAAATEPVEELSDDLELVAVITAAIAAQEGTSTDGFVVRSIRRRPSNNWN